MNNYGGPMKPIAWLRLIVATVLAAGLLCPPQAGAQVPARTYWKYLVGGTGVPLIFESLSGNTNPFDPAHTVTPGANFDATVALTGYSRTFPLFGRAAMASVFLPMGRISGEVTAAGKASSQSTKGYGDPMLELDVNILGPPAQVIIPDILRYEPGFSVDLLADLAVPIGEYDNSQPLNIGQNRWYGRLGLPVVWQLGAWVPGRRTTVELLPAVWLFGDNTDYVGKTMSTDPMFQLDAHLSRDLAERIWVALDGSWYTGGKATIDGVEGEKLNNVGVGLTLGYQVNDNMSLMFGYKSTINDDDPTDLRMDVFMATLVYAWHPLVEGMQRLKSGE